MQSIRWGVFGLEIAFFCVAGSVTAMPSPAAAVCPRISGNYFCASHGPLRISQSGTSFTLEEASLSLSVVADGAARPLGSGTIVATCAGKSLALVKTGAIDDREITMAERFRPLVNGDLRWELSLTEAGETTDFPDLDCVREAE